MVFIVKKKVDSLPFKNSASYFVTSQKLLQIDDASDIFKLGRLQQKMTGQLELDTKDMKIGVCIH